ncbi:hypothetical protein ACFWPQ_02045 [Streptomyces sp. NPDC058464]|uniref:hypothetical protein n=1 Tax=Streptomyces sp. NPDC058464 TaxID=3346511 RepID=UPI00364E5CF3
MNADMVHGYQHAGLALSPVADFALNFVIVFGPGVLLVGGLLAAYAAITRVADSFARARQTIADIQQPRKENQP